MFITYFWTCRISQQFKTQHTICSTF